MLLVISSSSSIPLLDVVDEEDVLDGIRSCGAIIRRRSLLCYALPLRC